MSTKSGIGDAKPGRVCRRSSSEDECQWVTDPAEGEWQRAAGGGVIWAARCHGCVVSHRQASVLVASCVLVSHCSVTCWGFVYIGRTGEFIPRLPASTSLQHVAILKL